MLNRLTIGTKLVGGFVLVLLLLLLVAFGGYWGLSSSAQTTAKTMLKQDNLKTVEDLRGIFLQAQIVATNGVLYRDTKFAEERKKLDKDFKDHADHIVEHIDQSNKEIFNKLIKNYDDFAAKDDQWYSTEQKREHEIENLKNKAELIADSLNSLSNVIEKVMVTPEETKEIDGNKYFSESRSIQLKQVNHCSTTFARLRRFYYQFFSEIKPENKEKIAELIKSDIKDMYHEINEFGTKLTTNEGKKLLGTITETLVIWEQSFAANLDYLREQTALEQAQSSIIAEMEKEAEELLKTISEQTEIIRKNSEETDRFLLIAIPCVSIFAFVVGLVISYFLARNITIGLKFSVSLLKRLAEEGDLTVDIDTGLLSRKDEVGQLATALHALLGDYRAVDSMANALAGGNWQIQMKEKGSLDTMNINLDKMITQVNNALHEINENVKQVAIGSSEVSSAATTLSSGAQESAASLEEITASMSEISGQTKTNAQSATEARNLAQQATDAASEGQEAMKEMNSAMDRITKNSTEIQRVIKVIDDIAFQTNLLALNAAVEAARAGAHGKGFAVVAEEVRNLAARSAKAAKETTDLIQTSGQEINKGGEVASHTAEVLNLIVEQIQKTTKLVADIATASNEQAQGVSQVTIGLQQIDTVTQQNTAAAEESASAANEMSSMAANLQQLVAKFKLR
jgi:methyl-accepting chemotaxis protein